MSHNFTKKELHVTQESQFGYISSRSPLSYYNLLMQIQQMISEEFFETDVSNGNKDHSI